MYFLHSILPLLVLLYFILTVLVPLLGICTAFFVLLQRVTALMMSEVEQLFEHWKCLTQPAKSCDLCSCHFSYFGEIIMPPLTSKIVSRENLLNQLDFCLSILKSLFLLFLVIFEYLCSSGRSIAHLTYNSGILRTVKKTVICPLGLMHGIC